MKKIKISFLAILFTVLCFPYLNVQAETRSVATEEELKNAINAPEVTTIELSEDIDITETIVVSANKTIDGKNHTLKYTGLFKGGSSDNTVWGNNTNGRGVYIIQVYNTAATIKDIKLTGGNAGLLINGADVKLEGTIDVSGNGFGGIELGQGSGITSTPKLQLNNIKIVNTSESANKPTFWIDAPEEVAKEISITVDGKKLETAIVDGKVNVYLEEENSPEYTPEEDVEDEGNENITEDNDKTDEIENPETLDNLIIYFVIVAIGMAVLMYAINRYTKEAEK